MLINLPNTYVKKKKKQTNSFKLCIVTKNQFYEHLIVYQQPDVKNYNLKINYIYNNEECWEKKTAFRNNTNMVLFNEFIITIPL